MNRNGSGGGDVRKRGVSVFGAANVRPRVQLFARLDYYDPDKSTEQDGETMVIGGVDIAPAGNIHVMPNVMATIYASSDADTEVIPRMTVFYKF